MGTDGTKKGVDLQAYVRASRGEGYCARNPSNDPCLGWQVFGDGCSDCASSGTSSTALASASLRVGAQSGGGDGENATHLQSTDPQRSCAFWDGLDIKDSVCPLPVPGPVRRDCLVQVLLGRGGLRVDVRSDGRHQEGRRPAGVRARISRGGLLRSEPVQRPVPRLAGVRRWLQRLLVSLGASNLLRAGSWSIRGDRFEWA